MTGEAANNTGDGNLAADPNGVESGVKRSRTA